MNIITALKIKHWGSNVEVLIHKWKLPINLAHSLAETDSSFGSILSDDISFPRTCQRPDNSRHLRDEVAKPLMNDIVQSDHLNWPTPVIGMASLSTKIFHLIMKDNEKLMNVALVISRTNHRVFLFRTVRSDSTRNWLILFSTWLHLSVNCCSPAVNNNLQFLKCLLN